MNRMTDRRTVLIGAGAAAVAAATRQATAQSTDFRGTVIFRGGAVIPKGRLEIYLEDPAIQDKARRRTAKTHIESDGKSRAMAFSLATPAGLRMAGCSRGAARRSAQVCQCRSR
jgi:uncharacterized lipoprotein YbaY